MRTNNDQVLLDQYKIAYFKLYNIIDSLAYSEFKNYLPKILDLDDLMLIATTCDIDVMRLVLNNFDYEDNPCLSCWCYLPFREYLHANIIAIINHGIKVDDKILFEAIFVGLHFDILFDDYLLLLSHYSGYESKMEGLLWFTETMTQAYSKDIFHYNLQNFDPKTKDLYIDRLKLESGAKSISYNLILYINNIDQPINFSHWDIATLYQHLPICLQQIIMTVVQVNRHKIWLPFEMINIILLFILKTKMY